MVRSCTVGAASICSVTASRSCSSVGSFASDTLDATFEDGGEGCVAGAEAVIGMFLVGVGVAVFVSSDTADDSSDVAPGKSTSCGTKNVDSGLFCDAHHPTSRICSPSQEFLIGERFISQLLYDLMSTWIWRIPSSTRAKGRHASRTVLAISCDCRSTQQRGLQYTEHAKQRSSSAALL